MIYLALSKQACRQDGSRQASRAPSACVRTCMYTMYATPAGRGDISGANRNMWTSDQTYDLWRILQTESSSRPACASLYILTSQLTFS